MPIVTGQNHMREERPSATFQFELGPQVDTATDYAGHQRTYGEFALA